MWVSCHVLSDAHCCRAVVLWCLGVNAAGLWCLGVQCAVLVSHIAVGLVRRLRTALYVETLSGGPWCILLQVYLERAEQLRNLLQKQ
jgi:hypothetical protein